MPDPVRLRDVEYRSCENGTMVCLTPEEAQAEIKNKTVVGVYIDRLVNLVRYYRLDDASKS